jgi:hypothetical protein
MLAIVAARIRNNAALSFRMAITSSRGSTRMSGSERLDSKAGPLGNLSQAYFGSLDIMLKGYEPALKGISRYNLELFGLMARRAQAWVEVGSRLSRCKTPVEVLSEQNKFWQTAASDYVESSKRLAAAWTQCASAAKLNGGGEPRDYITFPEPQEASAAAVKRGERKAA